MSDYNWFSEQNVAVATEAIRAEAKKWHELSDRMERVASETTGQGLGMTAFMVTDVATGAVTAADLKQAYDKMFNLLLELFKGATTEFEQFGGALKKIADWYERADADAVANMDKIWSA